MKIALAVALLALATVACTPQTQPPPPDRNAAPPAEPTVDPTAQVPYDLQVVDFVNVSHGWIVGNDEGNNVSVILRTANGGATWTMAAEVVGDTLLALKFVDERTGWAAGSNGVVYGSTDGGVTWKPEPASQWTRQYESAPVQVRAKKQGDIAPTIFESLASVFFLDAKRGWAGGDAPTGTGFDVRGVVRATADGGKTWTELTDAAGKGAPFSVNDLWFTSATDGWAAAGTIEDRQEDVLMHTADGGKTWERRDPKSAELPRAVFFRDADHGWAVGLTLGETEDDRGPSKILTTSDGGATWSVAFASPRSFYDVQFVDANRGWAVGDRASIYATTDGGKTWKPQTRFEVSKPPRVDAPRQTEASRGLRSIFALGPDDVWAAGDGVILKRTPGAAPAKPTPTVPGAAPATPPVRK